MSKQCIEVIIEPGGGISIEAIGYKGPACEQATKFLEQALGVKTATQRKPEYTQRALKQNTLRAGHEK